MGVKFIWGEVKELNGARKRDHITCVKHKTGGCACLMGGSCFLHLAMKHHETFLRDCNVDDAHR